ncbi:MAG TPA: hypothetical protein VFW98_13185 [Gemmatimonadaceae bacterium]|nr:hypothetical protein [Gemmatimonadaceae bacterium]
MPSYPIIYLHVVAAVVLCGYALFWVVMAFALRYHAADMDAESTLSLIGASRWPPFLLPRAVRVPILGLGWLLVLFMVVSGAVLMSTRGVAAAQLLSPAFWSERFGAVLAVKAALVVLFAIVHARLSVRPSPGTALTAAIVVVALICASALLV